jgi:hypothetical protein
VIAFFPEFLERKSIVKSLNDWIDICFFFEETHPF